MSRPSSYRVLKSCGNCAHLLWVRSINLEGSYCAYLPEKITEDTKIELNGLCDEHKMRMIGN